MATYTFLLSPHRLKQDSLVCDNVDEKYCTAAIKTAQDISLVELIGSKLYHKLCGIVVDKTINNAENEPYKILLDSYIIPYLVMQTTSELVMPVSYKLRNAGVTQSSDTQTQYATMEESQYLMRHYENKANFYGHRVIEWLNENSELIPEWYASCNCATSTPEHHCKINITI